jgi:hypothetical protein
MMYRIYLRLFPIALSLVAGSTTLVSAQQPAENGEPIMAVNDWTAGHCAGSTQLSGLDGRADTELDRMFGAPSRKETFRLGDRQGEFHVSLQNHYPLTVTNNAEVLLQEWTWERGKCRLTIWLHKPGPAWITLENLRYPVGAEF